jgi:glyoxylase-like metal-dependent hydrolase (beta-lactamase superfamily II)
MTETAFHYDIGKYRCIVCKDGYLINQDTKEQEKSELSCLFIDTGDHKILIDTGCGDVFQPDTTGRLVKNLEGEGIGCGDIDTIIFTHGHIDHAGGSFSPDGKPVFPNAMYVAAQEEWDYWEAGPGDNELQNMFFGPARKNLLPIREKFELVEDNTEILHGIKLNLAPGHTPGNMVIEISSEKKKLFCIGDIIHSPQEFINPAYLAIFDVEPGQALTTRSKAFIEAANSGVLVFACHLPFPGLGHIVRKKGVLSWEPLGS